MKLNRKTFFAIATVLVITTVLTFVGGRFLGSYWKKKACNTKYITVKKYKGLKIQKEKPKKVTDDLVDYSLVQYLQKENFKQHDTQSEIREDDTICLNYAGRYNGSSFRNSDVKGLLITLGNGSIDSSFEKQLIGHKPEEIFNVKMTLPENYVDSFVAGKEATFEVQVSYILKSVEIPSVITDDFLKKYTSYSTLAEYKQFVKKDLKKQETLRCEKANREKILEAFFKCTTVKKYPKKELQENVDTLREKDNLNALYSGVSEKEYRNNMGYKTEKAYEKHLTSVAKSNLKEKLAIDAIAKAENLEVPDNFSQEEQIKLAKDLGFSSAKDMNAGLIKDEIRFMVKKNYVADFLLKVAKD